MVVSSIVYVLLLCELGEMVSNAYEKVDQQLFNCNWYQFPTEMQRMLVTAIANIQQPVTIRGYGNIICNRDTLKKVKARYHNKLW